MSVTLIQCDYETLERTGQRFVEHAERTDALVKRLQRGTALLRESWQGRGAEAFLAEMEGEVLPAVRRLAGALDQASSTTARVKTELQQAESEAAALFKGRELTAPPNGELAFGGPPPSMTPTPPSGPPTPTPPSQGTTTPTPSATPRTIYTNGRSIADLASYQQNQGNSNACGEFSAAAALNILLGTHRFDGLSVDAISNSDPSVIPWWGLRWPWAGGATMPAQQANLINRLADDNGLPYQAVAMHASPEEILRLLQQPNTALMVTIAYDNNWIPTLTSNGQMYSPAPPEKGLPYAAHVMVLAAYEDNGGAPAGVSSTHGQMATLETFFGCRMLISGVPTATMHLSLVPIR